MDISDLTYFVAWLFDGGPEPPPWSCPPPWLYIEFWEADNKTVRQLSTKYLDNRLKLKISGYSGGSVHRYGVWLRVKVNFSKLKGRVNFDPQTVDVYWGDLELEKNEPLIDSSQTKVTDKTFETTMLFRYDFTRKGCFPLDSVVNKMRIVLDSFVILDGEPVPLDTIYASEPKLGQPAW
jgi:hypothetical protein